VAFKKQTYRFSLILVKGIGHRIASLCNRIPFKIAYKDLVINKTVINWITCY